MVYLPVCPSVRTSFSDYSYVFYRIALTLDGQLDYEASQRILFRGYSTPNFDR